jgi:hypothetical protein
MDGAEGKRERSERREGDRGREIVDPDNENLTNRTGLTGV